ncbi:MAG: glutathione peroxidase [Planctomycetaceae bacterium]|nr:glutathione peroxidase [Planctomycetaceae bacterium]
MKSLFCGVVLALGLVFSGPLCAAEKVPAVLDFKMKTLGGKDVSLSKYQGKVILIVNVASKCGATPQYEPLQKLYETYKDKGLVILGFPCNQFGKQEPGNALQIQEFCTANYGVTFDMFSKIDVNGEEAAPLYKHLTSEKSDPDHAGRIRWNFEKFLISSDGEIVERFATSVQPDSAKVTAAIQKELAK